jgi:sugar lactone lactonase YvrE
VREFTVAPETLDRGSTGGMALSPDQKFIYVSDIMNNVVGS